MNGVKTLSPERVAEIKAFKNINFPDCPIMKEDELNQLRPRHPENFKLEKQTGQIQLDSDILEWLKQSGSGYQNRANAILRQAMLQTN